MDRPWASFTVPAPGILAADQSLPVSSPQFVYPGGDGIGVGCGFIGWK
jgi:hypothetical protein